MLSNAMRLYDIATRLQVYTEGVKAHEAAEFNKIMFEIGKDLQKHFSNLRYSNLDALTKVQLNQLLRAVRKSQSKIFSKYAEQLGDNLKAFMSADLELSRRVWVSAFNETDEKTRIYSNAEAIEEIESGAFFAVPLFGKASVTGNDDRLWSQVTNAPISANGLYLLPFIKTFTNSAQAGFENIIRQAWANHLSVDETLALLVGDGSTVQGTVSQLRRVNVQAGAVIETTFAHVAAIVGIAVSSALFDSYTWHSVIDGSTTEICISRNQRTYRYGEGPIPPAHIRCRSHIAPAVPGANDIEDETFYTWVKRQPPKIQDYVLGAAVAGKLREGELKSKDVSKFNNPRPLTLVEFKKKIVEILSS